MKNDYQVPFLSESSISHLANDLRERCKRGNHWCMNIPDFIEKDLTQLLSKDPLEVIIFEEEHIDGKIAFVKYAPLRLYVSKTIWLKAKQGDEFSTYVLAHEIGHIRLHDKRALSFSKDNNNNIRYAVKECSAEWQAHTFAEYFLLPDHIVAQFDDVDQITEMINIPIEVAEKRFNFVKKLKQHNGQYCQTCNNNKLILNGIYITCPICGTTRLRTC